MATGSGSKREKLEKSETLSDDAVWPKKKKPAALTEA